MIKNIATGAKQAPNPIDRHVGSRARMRRMMLGLSQESLGKSLGLTFQQIQKYEKGANRISASRLQQLAHILEVPIPFFFDGAPDEPKSNAAPANDVTDFFATRDGLALAKAFTTIKDAGLRRKVIELVEAIASSRPK